MTKASATKDLSSRTRTITKTTVSTISRVLSTGGWFGWAGDSGLNRDLQKPVFAGVGGAAEVPAGSPLTVGAAGVPLGLVVTASGSGVEETGCPEGDGKRLSAMPCSGKSEPQARLVLGLDHSR